MAEYYDAHWHALRFVIAVGGEMVVEMDDVWARPSLYVLLDAAQNGLCVHEKTGSTQALFRITEAGRKRVAEGPRDVNT